MESVSCNLCGRDLPLQWLTITDRFNGDPFHLVRCQACGLIYLSPRPTMEEMAICYPDDYEAYQPPSEEMTLTQAWHTRRMWEMQINYVEKFVSEPGKLLDIGCATGEFLSTARDHGWQVSGFEMIDQSAEKARSRYTLDVITGTVESVELAENSFDAITMWDVLEHLPDPLGAFNRCRKLLRQDGVVIFSIPNLDSCDRYLFGKKWIGWDAPRHFTLFTMDSLDLLLKKTGYSLISRDCFLGGKGTFLLSLDNILRGSPIAKPLRSIYPLISGLLWPYRQLTYLLKRGPILAIAARKMEMA